MSPRSLIGYGELLPVQAEAEQLRAELGATRERLEEALQRAEQADEALKATAAFQRLLGAPSRPGSPPARRRPKCPPATSMTGRAATSPPTRPKATSVRSIAGARTTWPSRRSSWGSRRRGGFAAHADERRPTRGAAKQYRRDGRGGRRPGGARARWPRSRALFDVDEAEQPGINAELMGALAEEATVTSPRSAANARPTRSRGAFESWVEETFDLDALPITSTTSASRISMGSPPRSSIASRPNELDTASLDTHDIDADGEPYDDGDFEDDE